MHGFFLGSWTADAPEPASANSIVSVLEVVAGRVLALGHRAESEPERARAVPDVADTNIQ